MSGLNFKDEPTVRSPQTIIIFKFMAKINCRKQIFQIFIQINLHCKVRETDKQQSDLMYRISHHYQYRMDCMY